MQKRNEQPERYDRELESKEERGACPECHNDSMVNYIYTTPTGYTRFCLECGYKE